MHSITIPPPLLALIKAACAMFGNTPIPLPSPWDWIVSAIIHTLCGTVQHVEGHHAAGNMTPTITLPSWFWHLVASACKNAVPQLPAGPVKDLLVALCAVVPHQVSAQH